MAAFSRKPLRQTPAAGWPAAKTDRAKSSLGWTNEGSAPVSRAGSGVAPEPWVEPFSLGNGFWRDAENGNRDGRAPQQSPNGWPCAMVAVGKDSANGSLGWTMECAGRAGAATALSGGRETFVMRKISVRAKAGARCACPRSPRHAGARAMRHPLVEPFSLGNGLRRDAGNGNRDGRAPQQRPSRRGQTRFVLFVLHLITFVLGCDI